MTPARASARWARDAANGEWRLPRGRARFARPPRSSLPPRCRRRFHARPARRPCRTREDGAMRSFRRLRRPRTSQAPHSRGAARKDRRRGRPALPKSDSLPRTRRSNSSASPSAMQHSSSSRKPECSGISDSMASARSLRPRSTSRVYCALSAYSAMAPISQCALRPTRSVVRAITPQRDRRAMPIAARVENAVRTNEMKPRSQPMREARRLAGVLLCIGRCCPPGIRRTTSVATSVLSSASSSRSVASVDGVLALPRRASSSLPVNARAIA